MNLEKLKAELPNYTTYANGVNQYHFKAPFPRFLYSDGLQFLAQNASCYWLLDAIASYQPQCQAHDELRSYQRWTLEPITDKPGQALLACRADGDSEAPIFAQKISSTDFPFGIVGRVVVIVEPNQDQRGACMSACFPVER
jgi:hypothetical protein